MTGAQAAILAVAFTGIAGVLAVAAWLWRHPGDDSRIWAAAPPERVDLPALTGHHRRTGPMSGAPNWAVPVDDDTEAWLHQLVVEGRAQQDHRLARPARVMADPVRTRMVDWAIAMVRRSQAPPPIRPRATRPAYVSGPAPVPPRPAAVPPPQAAAGPETPYWNPAQLLGARHGPDMTGEIVDCEPLPPVDEASHLQPIDWSDTTGSFAAICGVDQ